MTDRPIIFSAPMVLALLAGRKTQTRRVLGARGRCNIFEPGAWSDDYVMDPGNAEWRARCTPFAPGDRLWVREAYAFGWPLKPGQAMPDCEGSRAITYRADGLEPFGTARRWQPSIHMPRWASRLTLTVTDVRVQRLHEISGRDAIAEGLRCDGCHAVGSGYSACRDGGCFAVKNDFRDLWNSLHGPDAWDANPWVAALTFTVEHRNIDHLETAS